MRLQPITRKERFLYEIVGWGETAPKNELTTEELFFAKILGRNVTLPDLSNVPRYYLLLAKIAGENVNVTPPTYVSPPLEFFLAKAAGMDVETPVPLTKEEIFWANYKGREQIIEGVPPLTFTAKAGTLSNYRIYGNTVNSESVGDKTGNLFNDADVSDRTVVSELSNYQIYHKNNKLMVNGKTEGSQADAEIAVLNGANDEMLRYINSHVGAYSFFTACPGALQIRFFIEGEVNRRYSIGKYTSTSSRTAERVVFRLQKDYEYDHAEIGIMVNQGATPAEYEPYGYRVPVTVNSNTTNIYLDEQLVKSGDDADYIDYDTQKRYNADGTSQSVELPTLQTVEGTNTLSVGTTVQPSKVMVKIGEASAYKVRYYVDDTMARVETVSDGKNAQGFTPTKTSTVQYNYTFMGWSTTKGSTIAEIGVLNDITADKSLYAVFSQSLRTFTVYFYNGSTLLQTAENVQYGGTATYTGETPTKDGFTFSGWQPSNVNITADTSCYAQFVEG